MTPPKTSLLLSFIAILLLGSCNNPISFVDQEFYEKHNRILRPEGGTIEFVNSFFSIDTEPEVLVSLEVPPGAVEKDTFFEIIRGDFFSFADLETIDLEYDTVILPMVSQVDTFDGEIYEFAEWRAMTGFLPNLLTFAKPLTLGIKYLPPNWNIYPEINLPVAYFYQYEDPKLYRLEIDVDLNGFFPGSEIDQYLFRRRSDWELVPEYTLDEDRGWASTQINSFNYLYFLAAERWRLTRDESVSITFSGSPWNEMISWSANEPATWQTPSTGDPDVDYLLDRSKRGFMQIDEASSYFYYDTFVASPGSPISGDFNRVLFGLEAPFFEPGTYQISNEEFSLNFLNQVGNSFTAAESFVIKPGETATLNVFLYGEREGFFQGVITGNFVNNAGQESSIQLDLLLRRTN